MTDKASLEAALQAQEEIVAAVDEYLAIEPNDEAFLAEKASAQKEIKDIKAQLSALETPPPPPPPPPPSATQKTSFAPPPPVEDEIITANVGDTVLAKYSGDKQFYSASVISKTGSASEPIYTVRFKSYGNVETVRKNEIKAAPASKKRKADGPPTTNTSTPTPSVVKSNTVISAAPSVDKSKIQKKEPSLVSDGPTRLPPEPKKLKNSKALDKAKSSWESWQTKAKTTPGLKMKDSQFRMGSNPNAKVGFVGSGKGMTKDPSRQVYKFDERDAEE